jgi:hypothetical protein
VEEVVCRFRRPRHGIQPGADMRASGELSCAESGHSERVDLCAQGRRGSHLQLLALGSVVAKIGRLTVAFPAYWPAERLWGKLDT